MSDSSLLEISQLNQDGSNAPVFAVDLDATVGMPLSRSGYAFRMTHALAPGIPLDALVVDKGSDTLVVSFHGATNRESTRLPRFERLRTLSEMGFSSMYVSDPTLHLDSKIWLGWYTGWSWEHGGVCNVHEIIGKWATSVAALLGVRRILFTGSSGGGFAALQVGALVPGSCVLAMNAQSDIGAYLVAGTSLSQQKDYVRVVWPKVWDTLGPAGVVRGGAWTSQCDSRVSALETYSVPRECTVYIAQNIEEYHYTDHFLPFVDAAWHGGNQYNVVPWVNRQGSKHVVPSLELFKELVERVVEIERAFGR
ncbi:hypothetical protein ACH473_18600 [Cellulosimicrobium funkei]|uniref:hypothetical protein n=1 Tax=Cellulosimicrobium funkei TaxID=264251 RepID=UPI0037ADABA3